jgi:N-carbamoyl-L-amino-acid hydrolase
MHETLLALVAEANSERLPIEIRRTAASTPAVMDENLLKALDASGEQHAPGAHLRMPSGAGHDTQYFAPLMPAAMMFVPSIGGISHHWSENTKDDDIVLGAQVFADGIANALKG